MDLTVTLTTSAVDDPPEDWDGTVEEWVEGLMAQGQIPEWSAHYEMVDWTALRAARARGAVRPSDGS